MFQQVLSQPVREDNNNKNGTSRFQHHGMLRCFIAATVILGVDPPWILGTSGSSTVVEGHTQRLSFARFF